MKKSFFLLLLVATLFSRHSFAETYTFNATNWGIIMAQGTANATNGTSFTGKGYARSADTEWLTSNDPTNNRNCNNDCTDWDGVNCQIALDNGNGNFYEFASQSSTGNGKATKTCTMWSNHCQGTWGSCQQYFPSVCTIGGGTYYCPGPISTCPTSASGCIPSGNCCFGLVPNCGDNGGGGAC